MANSARRLDGWAARVVALTVALLVSAYLVATAQRQARRAAPAGALEPTVQRPDNSVFAAPAPSVEPREAFLFSSKSMPVELDAAPSTEAAGAELAAAEAEDVSEAEAPARGSNWLFSSKSPVPIEFGGPLLYGPTPFPSAASSGSPTLRRIDPTYLPSSKFPSPLRAPTSGPAADDTAASSTPKAP